MGQVELLLRIPNAHSKSCFGVFAAHSSTQTSKQHNQTITKHKMNEAKRERGEVTSDTLESLVGEMAQNLVLDSQ